MTDAADIASYAGGPAQWPSQTADGRARRMALDLLQERAHTPTSVVTYRAAGSVLVIADYAERAEPAFADLQAAGLHLTVLLLDRDAGDVSLGELAGVERVSGQVDSLTGHLGAFPVLMRQGDEAVNLARLLGHERGDFDLILDLGTTPILERDIPPPGYLAPRDETQLGEALEQLPSLCGEFDKPKYFHYDPDICAHSSSGITGCTRCLDTCPTNAIRSLQDMIEVDPYLCQGGGVCATACPTGAITYQFPKVSEVLGALRGALRRYREEGGRAPVLLIHDDARGREAVEAAAGALPENVLPLALEEVAAAGLDTWLASLCYGAGAVYLLIPPALPQRVHDELEHQLGIGNELLAGLSLAEDRLQMIDAGVPQWWRTLGAFSPEPLVSPAGFAAFEEKRTTLKLALDHLCEEANEKPERVALPRGSPFGEIRVDKEACTLCMACVSVCPASALADGGDRPAVQFIESNCVQCGICAQACPEDAIDLSPSYSFDRDQRQRMRVLNEEQPFCCISCGKPFATQSMMERIEAKLAGHWMYQDPRQRKRLQMCEDCRVEDLFGDGEGLNPHGKSPAPGG